jgi:hypothetical protein
VTKSSRQACGNRYWYTGRSKLKVTEVKINITTHHHKNLKAFSKVKKKTHPQFADQNCQNKSTKKLSKKKNKKKPEIPQGIS